MGIKELFIDWLTESRYIRSLERFHVELRSDFTTRLSEKDTMIRSLRIELAQVKAESERMRLVLMPLGSPAGALYAAKFQAEPGKTTAFNGPQDWQGELKQMLQEEEDGIRNGRRVQEHEPRADDGA